MLMHTVAVKDVKGVDDHCNGEVRGERPPERRTRSSRRGRGVSGSQGAAAAAVAGTTAWASVSVPVLLLDASGFWFDQSC